VRVGVGGGEERSLSPRPRHGAHARRHAGGRGTTRLVAAARGPGRRGVYGHADRGVRARLARRGVNRVCVFAGSNAGARPEYAAAARALAAACATRGLGIVYGGGSIGLMGVLADAALAAGAGVVGVIPGPLPTKALRPAGLGE